jgi:fatty acid desaturase
MADTFLVACLAMIALGAGLIYLPAGLIVGGLLGAVALVQNERGHDGTHEEHCPER